MLRLDLKNKNNTVLFVDPINGVKILKQKDADSYVLLIDTGNIVCYMEYDSEELRDEVYEYVLNKINEYLFPQIEVVPLEKPEKEKPRNNHGIERITFGSK